MTDIRLTGGDVAVVLGGSLLGFAGVWALLVGWLAL